MAMIAFMIPDWIGQHLAVEDGLPASELHITFAYLDQPRIEKRIILNALRDFCRRYVPMPAKLQGKGTFFLPAGETAQYLNVDCPALPEFRH